MTTSKHRSRVTFRGREHHIGYYDTPEEARLAKEAVAQFLTKIASTRSTPTPPNLHDVCRLVNMGVYDGDATSLHMASLTLAKRVKMLAGLTRRTGSPYGTITIEPSTTSTSDTDRTNESTTSQGGIRA